MSQPLDFETVMAWSWRDLTNSPYTTETQTPLGTRYIFNDGDQHMPVEVIGPKFATAVDDQQAYEALLHQVQRGKGLTAFDHLSEDQFLSRLTPVEASDVIIRYHDALGTVDLPKNHPLAKVLPSITTPDAIDSFQAWCQGFREYVYTQRKQKYLTRQHELNPLLPQTNH